MQRCSHAASKRPLFSPSFHNSHSSFFPSFSPQIDSLAFNHDCQMLAMASRMKKDSLRLVHLPSGSVFSNWPTSRTPLHYVHCLAFSPRGGYLAAGNAKGKVLLYRIHHYAEA